MGDRENQEQVVINFVESDFCANFVGVNQQEECVSGLQFALPVAMTILSEQEHNHLGEFCAAEGCV